MKEKLGKNDFELVKVNRGKSLNCSVGQVLTEFELYHLVSTSTMLDGLDSYLWFLIHFFKGQVPDQKYNAKEAGTTLLIILKEACSLLTFIVLKSMREAVPDM